VHRRFRGYLNVAYARARLTDPAGVETALPADSAWLGNAGFSYEFAAWTASLFGRYVGPQRLDPSRGADGTRAGGFAEANARVSWRTRLVYPLRLDVDVRNLFDEKGPLAASFIYAPATIPIEGRRLLLSADVRFWASSASASTWWSAAAWRALSRAGATAC